MKSRIKPTISQRISLKVLGRPVRLNGKALREKEHEHGVRILTLCIIAIFANGISLYHSITNIPSTHSVIVHADARVTPEVSAQQEELQYAVLNTPALAREIYEEVAFTAVEEDIEKEQFYTIGSVTFKNHNGEMITTEPVEFDIDVFKVTTLYYPEWDYKERMDTINILWNFLVYNRGVAPMNASAAIANTCFEGTFGQEQTTHSIIADMSYAESVLGKGTKGYGIAQWTNSTRQKALLDYYRLAHEQFPNDWNLAIKVAECCMLYEELKAYSIFSDIHVDTTLEDACGRVCLKYEAYENSTSQWKCVNEQYTLTSDKGSGCKRLEYAEHIYNYFMNGE